MMVEPRGGEDGAGTLIEGRVRCAPRTPYRETQSGTDRTATAPGGAKMDTQRKGDTPTMTTTRTRWGGGGGGLQVELV